MTKMELFVLAKSNILEKVVLFFFFQTNFEYNPQAHLTLIIFFPFKQALSNTHIYQLVFMRSASW